MYRFQSFLLNTDSLNIAFYSRDFTHVTGTLFALYSCQHSFLMRGEHYDQFTFTLDTKDGERKFYSRAREMEELAGRAWRERLLIAVCVERHEPAIVDHRPRAAGTPSGIDPQRS